MIRFWIEISQNSISFSGKYRVDINIFGRPINEMPIWLNIVENIDSVWTFGGAASSSNLLSGGTTPNSSSTLLNTSASSSLIRSFSLHNKGAGDRDFNMPISVRCINKLIFILDSGNNRIKVLNQMGQFITHLKHEGLAESSATAMAFKRQPEKGPHAFSLISLNWRLKCMTMLSIGTLEDITSSK
jgi:hypothetical protein